jgi:hypothetical protein
MVVGALLYIVRYAHDVPYYDGWSMVEVLGGQQPVDAGWLWQPRNEHRIPLPKLVLLGLYSMSGWDFRAGMYFNVLLLAALAGGMMRVAAQQRGGTSYADAFFPLNEGQRRASAPERLRMARELVTIARSRFFPEST